MSSAPESTGSRNEEPDRHPEPVGRCPRTAGPVHSHLHPGQPPRGKETSLSAQPRTSRRPRRLTPGVHWHVWAVLGYRNPREGK